MSPEEFRGLAGRFAEWIARYHERIEEFPVLSRARPGDVLSQLPLHPPEQGLARLAAQSGGQSVAPGTDIWAPVFEDLDLIILPGLAHWQSPSFFGFFPCNASGPAILGEFLSAGM